MNAPAIPTINVGTVAALALAALSYGATQPQASQPQFDLAAWHSEGDLPSNQIPASFLGLARGAGAVYEGSNLRFVDASLGGIVERVQYLSTIADGWLGQGSLAPDDDVLKWLTANASVIVGSAHDVSLIPTEDGAVALRWTEGTDDFTAEVRAGQRLYLFVDHTTSDDYDELETALSPERLVGFLQHGSVS